MSTISSTTGVTIPTSSTSATTPATASTAIPKAEEGDFEKILKANISASSNGKVSEEALFAAIIPERLTKLKGADAAKKFSEAFTAETTKMKKSDGFIPLEAAAKAALKSLRADGTLTEADADKIYSESFDAAQLDSNKDALFDDRGSATDKTMAVESMEAALLSAEFKLDQISSGASTLSARKLDEATWTNRNIGAASSFADLSGVTTITGTSSEGTITPNGTTVDGAGGFLFKPVAGDGRLAVLSRDAVGRLIESAKIYSSTGELLETGRFTSYGDDGRERAKFSFSKSGGSYPKDLVVAFTYTDGKVEKYNIADPSKRHD